MEKPGPDHGEPNVLGASMPQSILVLGIGNVLWADEGFGVRCVEALHDSWTLSPCSKVRLMDGGTQGLYLLPYVQEADALLVFDAVDYGDAPGALREVVGDAVPRFMGVKKMSLHQTGFQEVLMAAELTGRLPSHLVLIGVQAEELEDYGGSLRAVVRARIPEALDKALCWLRRWGVEAWERSPLDPPPYPLTNPALGLDVYERERPSAEAAYRLGDARFLHNGEV